MRRSGFVESASKFSPIPITGTPMFARRTKNRLTLTLMGNSSASLPRVMRVSQTKSASVNQSSLLSMKIVIEVDHYTMGGEQIDKPLVITDASERGDDWVCIVYGSSAITVNA